MVSSVVGNAMFGIAMNGYPLVHSSRLHEVRHAALPQKAAFRRRNVAAMATEPTRCFMRHPLISFAAWTTVVTVVLCALSLALVEDKLRPPVGDLPRSIGLRVLDPADMHARDWRAVAPSALASSADPAAPSAPATARAQTLAWTR